MGKIGYLILSIVLVIILIPLLILEGIGSEIKMQHENPKTITDITGHIKDNRVGVNVSDEKDMADIKLNVYIVEKKELKEMYMEEYIMGVVAGEVPAEFDIEALKAQAVVARTYAISRMKSMGGKGCEKHKDADICTDSTHCQEWISKEDRFKAWAPANAEKYWGKITSAVEETKGFIMTYESLPVMYPLYFSTSGGKTENSQDVFSSAQPYLRSVTSPNEEVSPKYVSKVTFTKDEFIKKLSQSKYNIKLDKSKLASQVKIIERTEGGSVKSINVGTKTLKGTEVRTIMGLNSANFNIEMGKNDVVITVLGNGHGVGMSQWGASTMAREGKKYDEILKHYYQGIEIVKIHDVLKLK